MNSFFDHLNGKTKSKKLRPKGVLTKKIKCSSDCMDISNVKVYTIHYPLTIEDEGCRVNTYKAHIVSIWNIKQ
jgi:hypothetical protein